MIEPRGNFDPFFVAVEEVTVVKRSLYCRVGEIQNEKPKPFSREEAEQALNAFKELHFRATFLAEKRYRDCGVLKSDKPDGTVSYLHNKTIPFEKSADTTGRADYLEMLNTIQN